MEKAFDTGLNRREGIGTDEEVRSLPEKPIPRKSVDRTKSRASVAMDT